MKCPNCKKDFAAGVEAAYRCGYDDGHKVGYDKALQRQKAYINKLKETNSHLWDEILRDESNDPVYGISISLNTALYLIDTLQKNRKNKLFSARVIKYLQKQIDTINRDVLERLCKYIPDKL
ncbi:MAG: hypothetical protein JW837_18295 [Sedimentisphaerales bacterium]|nr:hypothetical protein [Sedimentisphaerales bacterium]